MITQRDMDSLKQQIGRTITVVWVLRGTMQEPWSGVLAIVKDFEYIVILVDGSRILIPFIGKQRAIQTITSDRNETMYENAFVPADYNLKNRDEIEKLRKESFDLEGVYEIAVNE